MNTEMYNVQQIRYAGPVDDQKHCRINLQLYKIQEKQIESEKKTFYAKTNEKASKHEQGLE